MSGKEILDMALHLPPGERMLLIDGLINSLDEPDPNIDRLWNEEAERRLEACRSGKMKTLSMEEVLDSLS